MFLNYLALTKQELNQLEGQTVSAFTGQPLGSVVNEAVRYLFYAAGIAMFIYLIIGGFQLLTSAGDPKAAEMGQKKVSGAIIGFIIIFVAYWLVKIVGQILNINFL